MMNNIMPYSILLFLLLCFSSDLRSEEQLNKAPTLLDVGQPEESHLLDSEKPFPVDAKIIALLESSEKEPLVAASLLSKVNEISQNFNIAEKYLMLIIRANIITEDADIHKAINWLNKAILLENKIAYAQLILPEFNQIHLNLAKRYIQLAQYKSAYEQKNKYLDKYRDYRKQLREQRLAKLNAKYETDLKVKKNELLKTEHELQRLQLQETEKEAVVQQRNIGILLITAIIFIALLIRQLKINATLKRLTERDNLTRLFNRQSCFEQGEILIESALKYQHDISLILIDIDNFEQVNQQYGYVIGDELIKGISELGKETIRPRDIFARIAGEEFAVILPQTNHEQAKAIAERFREKVQHFRYVYQEEQLQLTISVGVATLSQTQKNFGALVNAADSALTKAKNTGRNQVCSYINQDC
ncbi:GGDEF domain-containing protein [Colwellia sp. 1_MG-2023]|uniref:GGDEF domain-containing protein n=1 Tax=Colwellia sp. 1_MG-2023 TaxID=3062649 RepID=UPI0026E35BA2|nr:GGDEF domain-containing protein [Colwellia sp. 1_MG-2023]MDO6445582.1 GGDEF domain-containing protein [Colwellia sp. 1_MG-2023]